MTVDPSTGNGIEFIVTAAAQLSNCQKRRLVCILYDVSNYIVAIGHNSCTPPNGVCARLQTVQGKAGYTGTECCSTHAEANALAKVSPHHTAVRAEIYGHDFACEACEKLLHNAGVWDIKVIPEGFGSGLVKR